MFVIAHHEEALFDPFLGGNRMTTATTTMEVPPTTPRAVARGGKYLTFALGKEEYGLEILKVREIIGWLDITALPRTPAYVKGVVNLRGQVIVVVDLRSKFEMEPTPKTDQTCIIVVEIAHQNRKLSTGIIVDRVSEVLEIPAEKIEDAPTFGAAIDTDFILGMGMVGQAVKILLDINRVLGDEEIGALTQVHSDQTDK
jgi:purine-binding chemotaxis protein CheW